MPTLLVAYATYVQHTAEIAERIGAVLHRAGCAVELCDLARSRPKRPLRDYDGVIAGGPVHGGRHYPNLVRFVSQNCDALSEQRSAFFLGSLAAAGSEGRQAIAVRCLDETGWKPNAAAIIAGALLYRRCVLFKCWMMKTIIKRGCTDGTETLRNYAYTNRDAADQFANDFAVLLSRDAKMPCSVRLPIKEMSISVSRPNFDS